MRLLVTGFGPFGKIAENPSAKLAGLLHAEHRILPVSFSAVERFVADDLADYEQVLCLGVAARSKSMRLEMFAKNQVGLNPDVDGNLLAGEIEPGAPARLGTTLLPTTATKGFRLSFDAGDYLCNFIYYRALLAHPGKQIGFVHVPPFEAIPEEEQIARLQRLVGLIA